MVYITPRHGTKLDHPQGLEAAPSRSESHDSATNHDAWVASFSFSPHERHSGLVYSQCLSARKPKEYDFLGLPPSSSALSVLSNHSPHVALTNFDILTTIFEQFDTGLDSPDARGSRRQLCHAARTCKAFLEPALNSLWMFMESFVPLLRLLSAFERNGAVYVGDLFI
ncbi:hypothetical protein Hypma_001922 [Hypsizygus marmoreus]|uniref:Uncharacterized protein n=1 Tax=Hypsizygus marmoreus TaxID=39966 RepID=A0A369JE06_HYPMA|nr:hypothetical protein Hypma_001922 [Hypsizygus marmoreus]